jgi:tetratricopeptide (TPR) repeat protein
MHRTTCQNINAIGATLIISLMPSLMPFTSGTEVLAAQAKSHEKLAIETETWQVFASDRGGFSVLMPGKPTETIEPPKPQSRAGEYRYFFVETEGGKVSYYVSYVEFPGLPSQLSVSDVNGLLNAARDGAVKNSTLLKESNIILNDNLGREIEIKTADGSRTKARIYWVHPRLYILMTRTSSQTFPPASDRFLTSFKLLKTQAQKSDLNSPQTPSNIAQTNEATELYKEGSELYGQGRFQEALVKLEKALELVRKNADREGEMVVLSRLGRTLDNLKQYDRALEVYQQALAIAKQTSNRQIEGVILDYIGRVHQNKGDLAKALNFQQQALEIFRQIKNNDSSAIVLGNIGKIYHYQRQYDRALEAYQQTLVIFRQLSNRQGEGVMLDYIGSVYNSQGQYQKAMDFHEQALTIFRQIGNRRSQAIVMSNMGEVFANLNQREKAVESLEKALALFQEVGDRENADITINIIQRVRQKR